MSRITEIVDYVVLESVFAFNRAKINACGAFQKLRRAVLPLHLICVGVEFVASCLTAIANKLTHLRTLPKCDSWIALYQCELIGTPDYELIDDPLNIFYATAPLKHTAKTTESYYLFEPLFSKYASIVEFQEAFSDKYQKMCGIHQPEPSGKLILAQAFPDIVRIKKVESAKPEEDMETIVRSDVSFFSVTYSAKHNGLSHFIDIEIPKSHYAIGNELLSMEYVSRYLEYLPIYQRCSFNGTYVLQIIDEDMNYVNLNESQWILLTDSGYEVVGQKDEN
jgi:hypothetical protein